MNTNAAVISGLAVNGIIRDFAVLTPAYHTIAPILAAAFVQAGAACLGV